ncbi:hypothetical protein ACUW97_000867 [Kocuria rhizophila]|uniref:Uncharacterized protein n=1 Tax=Kocuria rhizophila (strain ATCC 9341 / DSM 348 / NBRC 103217 / DC2201) TaxID=378753 RepID=B2GG21_KOCRD|nr:MULTISPECIES: hypothetical protein [Kocuria]ASE10643.1 hypothetical protein CEP81_02585 [Kocuria rhizophila]MCC5671868.1 hypothetical protein [Kocuria rhizophila]MCC5675420.1 hypothetical protein [Kocuria rhizophila]MDV5999016.1 hypothetical protein [Kocuria rhizophila]VEH75271.1 Uncharacterised protein [Kocuria rhizophila]
MSTPQDPAAAGFTLLDRQDAADLATYVSRARSVDPQAAVRLQGLDRVLAAWVSVIHPAGLLDTAPVVLGLRTMGLAQSCDLDLTVAASAITDRLARVAAEPEPAQPSPVFLSAPPQQVSAAWAGIVAPRTGWSAAGTVASHRVHEVARRGVQAVADTVPPDAGAPVVQKVRSRVWGASSDWGPLDGPEIPDGAAFALDVLGFIPSAEPTVRVAVEQTGQWARLSTGAGHVLVKLPR